MNDETKKSKPDEVALFRYGLLADLVHLAPGAPGQQKLLEKQAAKTWAIPFSTRSRPTFSPRDVAGSRLTTYCSPAPATFRRRGKGAIS